MKIKNALVFTEDCTFQKQDLCFQNDRITDQNCEEMSIDAEGLYAIPGLIDIHLHGCMGQDFSDGTDEALRTIADYQAECGVTAFAPASMTLSEEMLDRIFRNAAQYRSESGAMFCGIHMEGPFFSPEKKGAQNGAYLREPDAAMFDRLYEACNGLIKIVDVAPERPGAEEFIKKASQKATVSIAHTMADYDTAKKAFADGVRHVTHMWNAMLPFTHRAPGVIGAAFASDCTVELICDGIHIHPEVIRAMYRLFGAQRIVLVSDSMRATGLSDGEYTLGGQKVWVNGLLATLEDGTIAGSVTNLMECMRQAVRFGIPLEHAVQSAAVNPAGVIGMEREMGSLSAGKLANIVLLDKELQVQKVFIRGKQAY